jgi:hypothetical protein
MKFFCSPQFKEFPWSEYPVFCQQLKQYGLSDEEAYGICECGSEELYFKNKETWNNVFIETRLAPKKTFLNKVGEFFARGTSCECCLGYRIAFMTLVAAVGWIAFFLEKL